MKILKKRILAFFIDNIIVGLALALAIEILKRFDIGIEKLAFLLAAFLLIFRDFIFRNASIGKKFLGLRVYDGNWEKPKASILLKRCFFSSFVGTFILFKAKFFDENSLMFFNYEKEKLNARVIDKKVYNNLKKTAELKEGTFSQNMTELYDEYLKKNYDKHY